MGNTASPATETPRLTFNINNPFDELPEEASCHYLVSGLIKAGTCVSLSAKAKAGKSSAARYLAVCVAKGFPFLGRDTQRGEVLILSIEDGQAHINTCLKALNHDPETDEAIRLVTDVSGTITEKMAKLRHALEDYPGTRLVIVDTLPKFARVKDVNSYDDWLALFDPLRSMLKDFPNVAVLFTAHSKKVTSEDVFDAMHGSVAIRAEFESNLGIFNEGGKKYFVAETRIGRPIPPTELLAQMVEVDEALVVADFNLGATQNAIAEDVKAKSTRKTSKGYEDEIIDALSNQPDDSMVRSVLLDSVKGKRASLISTLNNLVNQKVVIETGQKGSPIDPLTVRLDRDQLKMWSFMHQYGAGDIQPMMEEVQ